MRCDTVSSAPCPSKQKYHNCAKETFTLRQRVVQLPAFLEAPLVPPAGQVRGAGCSGVSCNDRSSPLSVGIQGMVLLVVMLMFCEDECAAIFG
eukprot:3764655-Amphidinium_carterae.1